MSPTKKRQTMGKMTRERELKERRAQKLEKKELRKQAALEPEANADDGAPEADPAEPGITEG